tara:strand:- start:5737 stop:7143 length:1407 start_codon:yes stop_codon:yes gene_type:complete
MALENLFLGIKNFMENKKKYPVLENCTIAIIGLGYVGLPLAVEFAKKQKCNISQRILKRKIIGFDINPQRLAELKKGIDSTNEVSQQELFNTNFFDLTNKIETIAQADVFIITVPTPIDDLKKPDLAPIKKASITVAKALKIRATSLNPSIPIVIYESTVYPGTTEEICIPLIEQESGLFCEVSNKNSFACGYSPERINPGDKKHRLKDIIKITSGSCESSAKWIDFLYGSIIDAGTHLTKNIKTAEAAKIIENTQRDINIALMNELAIIFKLLNIDTLDIIEAASTKWNFIKFKPGLVGGHCIGVDPYYLTYKAQSKGYIPEIVLSGRKINDDMSKWLAEQLILEMTKKNFLLSSSNILILGFTFKENCPDIRNTKVFDLVKNLEEYKLNIDIVDPWVNPIEAENVYGVKVNKSYSKKIKYDAIVCSVAHKEFIKKNTSEWQSIIKKNGIILDLKGIVPRELNAIRI